MKDFIRALSFLAFFTLISMSLAHAQTATKKSFVIGVELIEYQPYYGLDPENPENYMGYAREFFDAFAKEKGYTFEYQMLPVKRLFSEFFANNLDFKYPDNSAWSAEERVGKTIYYSDSACDFIDGLMVHIDNKDVTTDKIMEIGTVRGFTPYAYFDLINSNKIKVSEAVSLQALLRQVEAKRIDGVYGNIVVSRFALKDAGIEDEKILFAKQLPHHIGSYMISTMKYPEIINEINAFIKDRSELISDMRKRYHIKMFADDVIASPSIELE